jgi:hypothetical protein
MKYNHLVLISALVPNILSTMEIERASSLEKIIKCIYRVKTHTTSDQLNNNHNTPDKLAHQDVALDPDTNKQTPSKNSPRKDTLIKQRSFEHY